MHEMQGYSVTVILNLFAEGIRQARESARAHPHREVLTLNKAGRDVARIGIASKNTRAAFDALTGEEASFGNIFPSKDVRSSYEVLGSCLPCADSRSGGASTTGKFVNPSRRINPEQHFGPSFSGSQDKTVGSKRSAEYSIKGGGQFPARSDT